VWADCGARQDGRNFSCRSARGGVWWGDGGETHVSRGTALLGEAGFCKFRRAGGADCAHAPGAGGEETLGRGVAVFARAEFLHAVAGAGGDATGDLLRLAATRRAGRVGCGRFVCAAGSLGVVGAELDLCGARCAAGGCRGFPRAEGGGVGDPRDGGGEGGAEGAQDEGGLGTGGGSVWGVVFSARAVSGGGGDGAGGRTFWREDLAGDFGRDGGEGIGGERGR